MIEIGCRDRIKMNIKSLTKAELKVCSYVLENYESILNFNITELAEKVDASEASVVRFCKSIGYKGYQDFRINAAKDLIPKEKQYNPSLNKDDNTITIFEKIFKSEISVLNQTLNTLDYKLVEQVVDLIATAKRICFFGSGGSMLVAQDAQHKFLKIGIKVMLYPDADMQLMASALLDSGDIAFCISHSGTNINVVKCIKVAKEKGAKIIALTTQGKTPVSKNSDITLYTGVEETVFKSESVSTRIAQLAVIDSIIAVVALRNYDDSYMAIQMTRNATSTSKF